MNSLTIYRWGYPLILGIMDAHAALMLYSCCAHGALVLCSWCAHAVEASSHIKSSRFIFLSSLLFLASISYLFYDGHIGIGASLAFKTSLSHAISLPITYHHKVYVKQPDMQGCFSKQKPGPGKAKRQSRDRPVFPFATKISHTVRGR